MSAILPLLLAWGFAFAATTADTKSRTDIYAVIFEMNVDSNGKLSEFKVDKVIDPSSGTDRPVPIEVPQGFVDAVRARMQAKVSNKDAGAHFTYVFYAPADPDNLDVLADQ